MTAIWRKPKPAMTVARAILIASFPSLSVTTEDPKTRPDKYVVLEQLPMDYPNPAFTEPRVMANCYAKTPLLAGDLADDVLTALLNARGLFAGGEVKKFANPAGPYRLDHPDITDRVRFQVHGDLRISTR